jgi:hypothetical protein
MAHAFDSGRRCFINSPLSDEPQNGHRRRGGFPWRLRPAQSQQISASVCATHLVVVPAPTMRDRAEETDDREGAARATPGRRRPDDYHASDLAQCGVCGSPLRACTRRHGTTRARFYGCSGYHDRGRTVCANKLDIPMAEAEGSVRSERGSRHRRRCCLMPARRSWTSLRRAGTTHLCNSNARGWSNSHPRIFRRSVGESIAAPARRSMSTSI